VAASRGSSARGASRSRSRVKASSFQLGALPPRPHSTKARDAVATAVWERVGGGWGIAGSERAAVRGRGKQPTAARAASPASASRAHSVSSRRTAPAARRRRSQKR
jgi:hypothetical protein